MLTQMWLGTLMQPCVAGSILRPAARWPLIGSVCRWDDHLRFGTCLAYLASPNVLVVCLLSLQASPSLGIGPKAVPDVKTPGLADVDAKMKLQRVILSNPRCAGPTSTAHIRSVLKYHFQKEKEEKPAKFVLAAVKDLSKVGILQEGSGRTGAQT